MAHRPLAVLDANVLFPFQLRNFLLHLAAEDAFEPLWSAEIVDECTRALRRDAALSEAQCAHLTQQLRAAFPDAWVAGFVGAADAVALPDEGDRHVVALARHFEAEFVVTRNLKHFPSDALEPLGIEAIDPDAFAELLWILAPGTVLTAAEAHRCSLRRHPLSVSEYLVALEIRAGLPRTVANLRSGGFLELPR